MNLFAILLSFILSTGFLSADTLEELLTAVKQNEKTEKQINREREKRFQEKREERAQMLKEAKAELAALEQRSSQLDEAIDSNEKKLAELEKELTTKTGNLGELFGVVRQASGELLSFQHTSLTASQFGEDEQLAVLANSKRLPDIQKLRHLWIAYLDEIVRSGSVVRYLTNVITPEGQKSTAEAARVGIFTAINGGRFAYYSEEVKALVVSSRQPQRFSSLAQAFQETSSMQDMAIDPTRGSLLSMVSLMPDLEERVAQGGVIGYVIIGLGTLGMLIALFKLIQLTFIHLSVKSQAKNPDQPQERNPLGRIFTIYAENGHNIEQMEARLEEAILKETPRIESGQGLIKLLAAVAPMLGLLGTVVGMIATFQAITLFGTGDPKLMAGGISQALVTTVLGLIVAVPLLFFHALVSARSRSITNILYEQSAGLLAGKGRI